MKTSEHKFSLWDLESDAMLVFSFQSVNINLIALYFISIFIRQRDRPHCKKAKDTWILKSSSRAFMDFVIGIVWLN